MKFNHGITPKEGDTRSPLAIYRSYLLQGLIAYQFDTEAHKAVFFPRVLVPSSGGAHLEWRISAGLGVVYSVTLIAPKNEETYNVALVDMDEGFRIMSRIEGVSPEQIRIGMRVRGRVHPTTGDDPLHPIFVPD